jgi:hypothetical protein
MVLGGAVDKTMEDVCPIVPRIDAARRTALHPRLSKDLLMLAVPLILLASIIALRLRQSVRRHSECLGRTIARDRF